MGVIILPSTLAGGLTPICNECGIHLCWDISEEEFEEHPDFWEKWTCESCTGYRLHPS